MRDDVGRTRMISAPASAVTPSSPAVAYVIRDTMCALNQASAQCPDMGFFTVDDRVVELREPKNPHPCTPSRP
jgi:hypothetical protein